ncbi:restriction endonuclease PLD domain-containing protein [Vibrio splendidus]|uniref:restriction endonuclease PLD domain-containing protein n=1 Tax=Vibrio splendidus TaxID=29497 RepID=UPI000C81E47C|nr:restriction endonuclease PLD domain-containing protein [Vibrio splendidus]PMN23467.1 hypothetical protein BCT36_16355 [Vibrio splendidus]
MKYIDSSIRTQEQTLAFWLEETAKHDISQLHIQSGYFSIDALATILPVLNRLNRSNLATFFLVGSNDRATSKEDIGKTFKLLDMPRSEAHLGVVSYKHGLFHPKVYHFTRSDGSQTAFVGSSNFSSSGLTLNIEAGLILDTRDGDTIHTLSQIRSAIAHWFSACLPGFNQVSSMTDIKKLYDIKILGEKAVVSQSKGKADNDSEPENSTQPSLKGIKKLTSLSSSIKTEDKDVTTPRKGLFATLPVSNIKGFPEYIQFAPETTKPTRGELALTSEVLKNGVKGIIIKLNKDSARHFYNGTSGTANVSIPVEVVPTLRFGIYKRKFERPRVEFDVDMQYISDKASITAETNLSNIMAYGFKDGESGHGDIRMVVSKTQISNLLKTIIDNRLTIPRIDDLAIIAWPTKDTPKIRISFIDVNSNFYKTIENNYKTAMKGNEIVGKGSCWLPESLLPEWD